MKPAFPALLLAAAFALWPTGATSLAGGGPPVSGVRCAIPPKPGSQDKCLLSTQFPVAQHLLRWLVDPTASVQEYTGLRVKGMLVEYERGHPADVHFAYGSLTVYTASDAHIPPRPRFLEVYESHVLVFPPGVELFRQPNGPWYAEGSVRARSLSFSVWSTAPKGAVRAGAQHLYQALARQAG